MLARSVIRIGNWHPGTEVPATAPGEMQILFVLRGQLSWLGAARPGLLRSGWVRFDWQPAPASEMATVPLVADADTEVVFVTLPAPDLLDMTGQGAEALALRELLADRFERQQALGWEDRAWLGALAAHDLPCRARDLWTRLRLAEMLLRLLLPEERAIPAGQDDRIRRAQAWIERHLDEPLDQEALAAHLNCSTRTLRRWLREELDLAPAQWQRLLRLQRAATLLREGRGAAEAGVEVGYPNAAHFSNLFKLHYQCPPSQYRQRVSRAG